MTSSGGHSGERSSGRTGERTSDYSFDLPQNLIAQSPPPIRGSSRLMVVNRNLGSIDHAMFADLPRLLDSGDLLIRNTSRVLRARLLGTRDSGAPAEVLLLREISPSRYEAMVRPGGKLKPGRIVRIADDLGVRILEATERHTRIVELMTPLADAEAIERYGHMPLPPYILRPDDAADTDRYQTIYSREIGSVAAPTAGLHFTPELIAELNGAGVKTADVLLHVGAGTFKPVEVEDPAEHVMHEEWFRVPEETADAFRTVRAKGKRVVAVGTTTMRTLESSFADGELEAGEAETSIFIRPPSKIRAADALLTNFHLPGSTLIMLVAAFAGYELTMHAYREAIAARYRFYSYGDAMLIV